MENAKRMEQIGLDIARVATEKEYNWHELETCEAVILEGSDPQQLWNFLQKLRSQPKRRLYLKPVFLSRTSSVPSSLLPLFDGMEQDNASIMNAIIEKISSKIEKLSREAFHEKKAFKVAVIDDDKLFLTMFSRIIEDNPSFELEWAVQNIEEAIDRLQKQQIDVFFVDVNLSGESGLKLIEKIKSFSVPHVVIVSASPEHALEAIELEVSDYLVKPIGQQRLNQLLTKLVKNEGQSEGKVEKENHVLRKTLEFIFTRNMESYEPIRFLNAKTGYIYPMLSENVFKETENSALDLLEHAKNEDYLEPGFFEYAYFCNKCANAFLHYRESCPKCKSLQLQQEDLVHHFRCAYVGPVSDFKNQKNQHELICPKCDKKLKHIGVDYDKPSLVYSCQSCKNVFQEPDVMAKCIACGNDDKVEYLNGREIPSYRLTWRGEQIVKGMLPMAKKENGEQISSDEIYFYRFFFKEIDRKSESNFESCLAFLEIENMEMVYAEMGHKKSQELQREIFELIRSELPLSTEINFGTPHQVWFIFPDKSIERTNGYLKKLQERLESILSDNISRDISTKYRARPISTYQSPRDQIAQLKNE